MNIFATSKLRHFVRELWSPIYKKKKIVILNLSRIVQL